MKSAPILVTLDTIAIDRRQLLQLKENLLVHPGYVSTIQDTPQQITTRPFREIPPLALENIYELFDGDLSIDLTCRGVERITGEQFFKLARSLQEENAVMGYGIDINESGRKVREIDESMDVYLDSGLSFKTGPMLTLAVGGNFPGNKDLEYRQTLFNRLFRVLGLQNSLHALFRDGNLTVESPDGAFVYGGDIDSMEQLAQKVRQGMRMYKEGLGERLENTNDIQILGWPLEELAQKTPDVIEEFGGEERIFKSKLSVNCSKEQYERVRTILNDSGLGPWKLQYEQIGKYSIENIEEAIAENDSFLILACKLQTEELGEIEISVGCEREEGKYYLSFNCVTEGDPEVAEKALYELIVNLAEGENIVDEGAEHVA